MHNFVHIEKTITIIQGVHLHLLKTHYIKISRISAILG